MAGDLFEDLPPPAAPPYSANGTPTEASPAPPLPPLPAPPALKSALKRTKPAAESQPETSAPEKKRLRFKTATDASETQVIEAMQKIASHIKNTSKFSKASKLALQLIQAGSVKPATRDHFFAILEAAMSSLTACNEPPVRADYHELFTAAQDTIECLSKKQQNMITTWTMRAVVANDLFTDESFTFSKATGRIKEAISNLPVATEDDDGDEAAALKEKTEVMNDEAQTDNKEESDPFGLDDLIPSTSKKDDKSKVKRVTMTKARKGQEEEETKRFLRSQREALISCLEIAANRYKTTWCQTSIDILVKHAFDNVSRFTSRQRDAIEKLWASVREQKIRRKQGKSVSGKLDVSCSKSSSASKGLEVTMAKNAKVFFDISIGKAKAGRVVMELFKDKTPKTAENF
ncbi:hypothetical protein K7X08_028792 [Anisodus acutangulus]|uniref:Uncharacterized protein n=1 Tax=Anisodus acutangulus TaxID=402998 RepID=A0A9Q1L0V7_9SOLA|nr:hypothetical protein K7X08_028792 [Anisodus acutangulus]